MPWIRNAAFLLTGVILAGCFSANGSLYGDATPLQPFKSGAVTARDHDGKLQHLVLRLEAKGVYRFTVSDRNEDFGEGFLLRFFALPGAPAGLVVFEALDVCKPHTVCKSVPSDTPRLYGLARITPDGAAVTSPTCPKDGPLARSTGVTPGAYGLCTFSNRAALEKSLLAVVRTDWKPDMVYRYY